jgi:hypothetical protein
LQSKTPAHLTGGTIVNTKQKTKQANLKKKISQDK